MDQMDQMDQGIQGVAAIRKLVKVLPELALVTMLLNLVVCSDTVSPAFSCRIAEPEETRNPSAVSQRVM